MPLTVKTISIWGVFLVITLVAVALLGSFTASQLTNSSNPVQAQISLAGNGQSGGGPQGRFEVHLYQCKEVRIRPIQSTYNSDTQVNIPIYPYFVSDDTNKRGVGPVDASPFSFSFRLDEDGNAYKLGANPDTSTADGKTGKYNDLYYALIATNRLDQEVPSGPTTITLWNRGMTVNDCLLYTSPSPRDRQKSRMPSSA